MIPVRKFVRELPIAPNRGPVRSRELCKTGSGGRDREVHVIVSNLFQAQRRVYIGSAVLRSTGMVATLR